MNSSLLKLIITFLSLISLNFIQAATINWTGGGSDFLWSNPSNWDAGIPMAGDDVVVNGLTATDTLFVDVNATVMSISSTIGVLKVNAGISLLLNGATIDPAYQFSESYIDGNLSIANTAGNGIGGSQNFNNNGEVFIGPGITGAGFAMSNGYNLNNFGSMTITDAMDGITGIQFSAINNYGTLNINNITIRGVYLSGSLAAGYGIINHIDGIINIDQTTTAISFSNNFLFDNYGTINVSNSMNGLFFDQVLFNNYLGAGLTFQNVDNCMNSGSFSVINNYGQFIANSTANNLLGGSGDKFMFPGSEVFDEGTTSSKDWTNNGLVAPGGYDNVGIYEIIPYQYGSGFVSTILDDLSIIHIDIQDNSGPGTGHDQLNFTNEDIILNGELRLNIDASYEPTLGDCFDVMLNLERFFNGAFDTNTWNRLDWNIEQGPNYVRVCVSDTVYADTDDDGFGDINNYMVIFGQTTLPDGYVLNSDDCDDTDSTVLNPGSSCDDGDDCTENDVYQQDCTCVGTLIDEQVANASCADACNLTSDFFDFDLCECVNLPPNVDDGCALTTDSFDAANCEIINAPPNVDDACALTTDSFDAANCVIVNAPPNVDDGCILTTDSFDAANCEIINAPPNVNDGCALTTDSFDAANCAIINTPPNVDDGCALTTDSFDAANCVIINAPPNVDDGCALTTDSFDAANCEIINAPPNVNDGCALTTDSFDAANCEIINAPPNVDDACALTTDSFDVGNCEIVNAPPNVDDGCALTTDSFDVGNCEIINAPPNVDDGCNLTTDSFDVGNCEIVNAPPNVDDGCALTTDSFDAANCEIINAPPNVDDGCALTTDSFDAGNCVIINAPPNVDDGCALTTDSFDVGNCVIINAPPNVDDGCALTTDSFDVGNCEIINAPPNVDDGCALTTDSFDAANCEIVNAPPNVDDVCALTTDSFDAANCEIINAPPNVDDACALTTDSFDFTNCEIVNEPPNVDDGCALTTDSFDAVNCEIVNAAPNVDDSCDLTTDSFDVSNCLIVNAAPDCNDDDCGTADSFNAAACECINSITFDCDDGCDLTTDSYDSNLCVCVNTPPNVDDGCALTTDSFDVGNCEIINAPPNVDDACALTTDSFDVGNCAIINAPPDVDDGCALTTDSFDVVNCEIINAPPNVDDGCDLTTDSFDVANCAIINAPPNVDDDCVLTTDSFDAANCEIINAPPNVDDDCDLTADSFDAVNCEIINAPQTTCNTDCSLGDIETWDANTCSCLLAVQTVFGCTDPAACNYDVLANCEEGSCEFISCLPGSISSTIYVDQNENGIFDSDEMPLAGASITMVYLGPDEILGTSDDLEFTTVSQADGSFLEDNLDPGIYQTTVLLPDFYVFDNGTNTNLYDIIVENNFTTEIGTAGEIPVFVLVEPGCNIDIDLLTGWNIISSYCHPTDPDMPAVFNAISDTVIQVKNLTDIYVPALNYNTMSPWDIGQGYQVKVNKPTVLGINGMTEVDPLVDQIPLNTGWNIIAYWLKDGDADPADVFDEYAPKVIQVKNLYGAYAPALGFNGMGNMTITQGYQVKMAAADVLMYDPADGVFLRPLEEDIESIKPEHFVRTAAVHPNNTTFIIKSPDFGRLNYGDEIAVFNKDGILAGAGVYQGGHIGMLVYGNESELSTNDFDLNQSGMETGESFYFKLWDKLSQKETTLELEILEGPATFEKDALTIAQFKTNTGLEANNRTKISAIPNPVSHQVLFSIHLSEMKKDLRIQIYNMEGKLLEEIQNRGNVQSGLHQIPYNVDLLSDGIYMYKLIADGEILAIEKLTVAK